MLLEMKMEFFVGKLIYLLRDIGWFKRSSYNGSVQCGQKEFPAEIPVVFREEAQFPSPFHCYILPL